VGSIVGAVVGINAVGDGVGLVVGTKYLALHAALPTNPTWRVDWPGRQAMQFCTSHFLATFVFLAIIASGSNHCIASAK
jgi:hypothetical protein